jgi:paraquat-inducible protein A
MSLRNKIAYSLTVFSLILLYPGVTWTMFTLTMKGKIDSSLAKINLDVLDKSSSIIQTVEDLYKSNDNLVASLILFFSVGVPLLKAVLVLTTLFSQKYKRKIFSFVKAIGKWSMADVFVVAIFLAYLSTKDQLTHSTHTVKMMGFSMKFSLDFVMHSKLGEGFYFFLAYCLISLCALQIFSEERTHTSSL